VQVAFDGANVKSTKACIARALKLSQMRIILFCKNRQNNHQYEHVIAQKPPAPISVQDAALLFPKESAGLSVEADEKLLESIRAYQEFTSKSHALSSECERLKLEILSYMGHAERLTRGGKTLATWRCSRSSTRIDTRALAQAHPEIASAFTTDMLGSRRFLLKEVS
jgi:hypothetical protein